MAVEYVSGKFYAASRCEDMASGVQSRQHLTHLIERSRALTPLVRCDTSTRGFDRRYTIEDTAAASPSHITRLIDAGPVGLSSLQHEVDR